ncbi:ABC transporter ATP-binding protein [Paenibacillus sp. HB172176]|uniref:ABC transporter ATP-binding protein n=1 Tax=Paenibacillus sp. HB172176 TaxID=2493690 RepID=UPI00143AC2E2|nr:ABC transporter ATP-binding protein [Paenibacillus sp. HB172176]
MAILEAKALSIAYGEKTVLEQLDLRIPPGKITVLIGSNGCGKSTLLRTIARLRQPSSGAILLDGKQLSSMSSKEIARQLAMLPQGPEAPEGLTVRQLVRQGRYPHQSWLKQWSQEDERMVKYALDATRTAEFAERSLQALSGGQRQRAWIALALAQGTDMLLLDEPTTYLDLTHQVDILDMLFELNEREGRTIVMVLHDLNLACRYAHHMVAVSEGGIYDEGPPEQIMTEEMVRHVFRMRCRIAEDPIFHTPYCIPEGRGRMISSETRTREAVQ